MADIVLTGATGLLGSNLLGRLAEEHNVVALARRPPGYSAGVRWITHDLRLPRLPAELPENTDVVIHLAQDREFRLFPSTALDTFAINVGSTARLADWANTHGARQLILASTGGVYASGSAPHHEDEPVGGPEILPFYPASKLASEQLARAYCSHFVVTVLRPFFIYGRNQDSRMLLPRLVNSIRSRNPIPLQGESGMCFNPIHVSDAAEAVTAAIGLSESSIVNLGGPEVLTLRQAGDILASKLRIEATYDVQEASMPTDLIGDISNMVNHLYRPRVRLVEAAAELCD